ncbi:MAG: hypothetical protein V4605_06255 [Pseudomonadota bacterium]
MNQLEMHIDIIVVKTIANDMRRCLESLPKSELGIAMGNFPKGACGDTSLLLGAYLSECGFPNFNYIFGERGSQLDSSWTSHAWLAHNDLIVDITADQFVDMTDPVIVTKYSKWHQQFNTEDLGIADFRQWTGIGTHHLYQIYTKLKPLMNLNPSINI